MTVWRKLRQNRAETLVETLVSILIVALASGMLLTAVTTASRLNKAARDSQETYETALEATEAGTVASGTGNVTISDGEPDGFSASVEVSLFESGDFIRWSKT